MLPLNDERWALLTHAYGRATDIPAQLARLLEHPLEFGNTFDGLDVGALNHQNSVSTALYAAIPHLVELAKKLPPARRENILTLIGVSVADAALSESPPIPAFLRTAYDQAISESIHLLAETLTCPFDEGATRWLLAAMAGLKGHTQLSHVLSSLDSFLWCPSCGAGTEPMKSNLNLEYARRQRERGGDV